MQSRRVKCKVENQTASALQSSLFYFAKSENSKTRMQNRSLTVALQSRRIHCKVEVVFAKQKQSLSTRSTNHNLLQLVSVLKIYKYFYLPRSNDKPYGFSDEN